MEIISLGIQFIIETAFLTLALWVLVKLQKFQFNLLGVVGSAAVASGCDLIPLVGHYLAVPALFLCMMKVTREDRVGLIFTIGVSYALTFGMNLFLMGSLMGDLGVLARSRESTVPAMETVNNDEDLTNDTAATTNAVGTPGKAAAVAPQEVEPSPGNSQAQKPQKLMLKGIIKGPKTATVMISAGNKTYSLFVGDSVQIETAAGKQEVALVTVKDNTAVLKVDGQVMELSR